MNIKQIITPAQAKAARHSVGLSQAQVARETGISRTKLALFEVEKYLLDDETLSMLRAFFQINGEEGVAVTESMATHEINQEPVVQPSGCQLLDGYAVPAGSDMDVAEALLEELAVNGRQIDELARKKAGQDWLFFEADHEERDALIQLMARNFLLSQRLQGRELLVCSGEQYTNADAVVDILGS